MEKPRVYTAGESCVQCNATEKKMDQLGIERDVVSLADVSPEQIQEWRANNLTTAPIVEANGEIWSGYRPDKLGALALVLAQEGIE